MPKNNKKKKFKTVKEIAKTVGQAGIVGAGIGIAVGQPLAAPAIAGTAIGSGAGLLGRQILKNIKKIKGR